MVMEYMTQMTPVRMEIQDGLLRIRQTMILMDVMIRVRILMTIMTV